MTQPTDDQVWEAMTAGQEEAATWRVMVWPGLGAVAINDQQPLSEPGQQECTVSYERHEFKDSKQAQRYIEWRSFQKALQKYEEIRK